MFNLISRNKVLTKIDKLIYQLSMKECELMESPDIVVETEQEKKRFCRSYE